MKVHNSKQRVTMCCMVPVAKYNSLLSKVTHLAITKGAGNMYVTHVAAHTWQHTRGSTHVAAHTWQHTRGS
jgi:hypothetical protein